MYILQSSNTSATATPEEQKSQCSSRIEEECGSDGGTLDDNDGDLLKESSERDLISLEGSFYRPYIKTSDPIPIG